MNTNSGMMFMNALGQQMANARGAASAGQRQALAQACEIAELRWHGPVERLGQRAGWVGQRAGRRQRCHADLQLRRRRRRPRLPARPALPGRHRRRLYAWLAVGEFLPGPGLVPTRSASRPTARSRKAGFYVDALAGYAYYNNQLQRQIMIPGLDQRTATGSTGANQFLGQIEGGYKFDVYAPAAATITPFGRFQISSVTQNGVHGDRARNRSTSTWRSRRRTRSAPPSVPISAAPSASAGTGSSISHFRLGWMHEFADTGRPITAAFAGAPGNAFTVFAAPPARNSAVLGLSARPPSPRRRSSTCATTARSPLAPTTSASTSACA